MRYSTTLATTLAIFSPLAAADWGWPEKPFTVAQCGPSCNTSPPSYSDDKVADYCNELVKDGCHGGLVTLPPGAITFAANRDIDCKDTGPRDVEQCQKAFKAAFLDDASWVGPGQARSRQMYVYNHNGDQAGAIGVTGGCIPIDPLNPALC
ncbi:hypothetical protein NW762_013710 [Fusarium torreyae]|uniref:Uncharacterized protein n=1 Tax=Fusarium torreyae TaxID=1237075 RepID=A0A9W8RMU5_9HYPO|nr:hypothetical protein NW762_013710 [Fusarium torreyae]